MVQRVLIVEDDLVMQKILVVMMTKLGLQAETAIDGAEAIFKISRNSYDVILLDILMPAVSGDHVIQVLEQLYRRQILSTPPYVIVVTGVTDKNHLSRLTTNECVAAVLDKNLDLKQLRKLVTIFTEHRSHSSIVEVPCE